MKKSSKLIVVLFSSVLFLASCTTSQQIVGNGAQGASYKKEWNHYMLYGLVTNKVADPADMAGTAKHYTITTKRTFVNGLLAAITLGIYTPTETTITR